MTQHESAAGFSTLLETMAQLDFFTLVLPFVLSYTIFFLALRQVDLFENSDENRFEALIAIVASFFVAQFIATNPWYQDFFVEYFGALTVGLVGILGLFILLAMMGWDRGDSWGPGLAIVAISIAGAAFLTAGGFGEPYGISDDIVTDLNWAALLLDTGLIWILIIGGVLWWLSKDGSGNGDEVPGYLRGLDWLAGRDPSERGG